MTNLILEGWTVSQRHRRGGQGQTYLVHPNEGSEDEVYVAKVLRRRTIQSYQRFTREAEAIRSINHPNVVKLINFYPEHNPPFLVMDYVRGGSFHSNKGHIVSSSIDNIIKLFIQVCEGIEAAHSVDVIHRDIKPSNILLKENLDHAVVCDFGIAFYKDQERLTRTHEAVGPQNFIAPELAEGRADVQITCDIYSLGKVLHWMLSGVEFAGDNHTNDGRNIVIIRKDDTLNDLNRVIGKAISYNPTDRYRTVREMIQAVHRSGEIIESGIPDMDYAYIAYYDAAKAISDIKDYYESEWNSTSSNTKMKSILRNLLSIWGSRRDNLEEVVDDYIIKDLRNTFDRISGMHGLLDRNSIKSLGDYHLLNAIRKVMQFFELGDETYLNEVRAYNYDSESAEKLYASHPAARPEPKQIENLRRSLSPEG